MPPIVDIDKHQAIVTAALAAKSSAETPKKARSEVGAEPMHGEIPRAASEFTLIEAPKFHFVA
jgi:hypothetical protein